MEPRVIPAIDDTMEAMILFFHGPRWGNGKTTAGTDVLRKFPC